LQTFIKNDWDDKDAVESGMARPEVSKGAKRSSNLTGIDANQASIPKEVKQLSRKDHS